MQVPLRFFDVSLPATQPVPPREAAWRSRHAGAEALAWGFRQQLAAVFHSNWTTWAASKASLGGITNDRVDGSR